MCAPECKRKLVSRDRQILLRSLLQMPPKTPRHVHNKIIRDQFTERFLMVMVELVRRGALASKTTFWKAAGITSAELAHFENSRRNFPDVESRRSAARQGLRNAFFVNPDYLNGISDQMLLKDPPVMVGEPGGRHDAVKILPVNVPKVVLIQENIALKEQLAAANAKLADCEARMASVDL